MIRRIWLTLVFAVFMLSTALVQAAEPKVSAKAYVLLDHASGKVRAGEDMHRPLPPASLTKMMTAYLTYKAIADGTLKLNQRIPVSRTAARQPPSRLGLKTGDKPTVRYLLLGALLPSGNDAAVALAEAVGGSVKGFANLMNREARRLGMTRTKFKNPSGLPEAGHVSTAYDMALLARALVRDYPQYQHFYGKRSFEYKGRRFKNHNHLLGQVKGLDGLKTGWTRAAGSCLATTTQRGKKRVVAVILGAPNRFQRDASMKRLIEFGFKG